VNCGAHSALVANLLMFMSLAAAVLCTWMVWDLATARRFEWDDRAPRRAKVKAVAVGLGLFGLAGFYFVGLLKDFIDRLC
jgi:hypothetical protein